MVWTRLLRIVKRYPVPPGFVPEKHPDKLNLGCGLDKREGYLNVDLNAFHNPDLVCDVSTLTALPSGYYRKILALDILEHITRPKIQNTLKEWNRVMQINGTLEFQVPCATGLLKLLLLPENRGFEMQNTLLQCLFGTQTYEGDYHHFAFTEPILKSLLQEAGFEILHLETVHDWLFRGQARKIRHAPVDPVFTLPDTEFIHEIYRMLLKREVDPEGILFYLDMLRKGICREAIVEAIKNSAEYKNLSMNRSPSER